MKLRDRFVSKQRLDKLLKMEEVIKTVERAFKDKSEGKVQMPPKSYLYFERYKGDLRIMPAYLKSSKIAGVKLVNAHPLNPIRFDMPTVMALIILVSPQNGEVMAIMEGTSITAFRTGAAGAIAIKYLARKDVRTGCFIGAGCQARTQLMGICSVRPSIKKIKVYDKDIQASVLFQKEMAKKLNKYRLDIEVMCSAKEAVKDADVIVTTTPSRDPIIKSNWVKEGVHINAIGADAPFKQELDYMILRKAKIVVDDITQAVHSGEINVPIRKGLLCREDIYTELGQIVTGDKEGRCRPDEITVFDSTGLAIQDISVSNLLFRKLGGYK